MVCYSVQREARIFVKGYGVLPFAKNMGKNIGENISKNLSCKYSQTIILDHAKQSATDAFNTTTKRVIQKTAEATGDLVGNKIANEITGEFQKIHNKVIQKQLRMIIIRKYIKTDIYL